MTTQVPLPAIEGTSKVELTAAGQAAVLAATVLPADMTERTQKLLEDAGVVLGEWADDDALFRWAELPPGWTKRSTVQTVWTDLLDAAGAVRARIYYDAPGRVAFIEGRARYAMAPDPDTGGAWVLDNSTALPTAIAVITATDVSAQHLAVAWLDQHFPDWRDVAAYWTEETP